MTETPLALPHVLRRADPEIAYDRLFHDGPAAPHRRAGSSTHPVGPGELA